MNQKRFLWSEVIGAPVICCTVFLLHTVYPLSGGSALSILFGAVNESVWEHIKIFAAGYTAWAILELLWNKLPFKKFLVAKVASLYLLSLLTAGACGLFSLLFGRRVHMIDILLPCILVCGAQITSFLLTKTERDTGRFFHEAVMLLMLYFLSFFSFTIFPPRMPLFWDPISQGYGIPPAPPI